jgi:hypothetical protein
MTSSSDLIRELEAARPAAPLALRARVREIAAQEQPSPASRLRRRFRIPARRFTLIALPAALALAIASAGVLGLARSDSELAALPERLDAEKVFTDETAPGEAQPTTPLTRAGDVVGPTADRVQRVSATLTLEVSDSDEVSSAAQEALALTRRLGGHVVNASVTTGEEGSASLTVRVPVARVQQAVVELSALGRIVSQQVTIDDLQETIDALERRERSVRAQIAVLVARLDSDSLDEPTRARLQTRLQTLREELRSLRRGEATTRAEGRMATIQLGVVTPESQGSAPVPSRLDRTLDEALNVLVWEGVIVLAIAIVAAPFGIVALLAWLGRKAYRRREEDRLLAT